MLHFFSNVCDRSIRFDSGRVMWQQSSTTVTRHNDGKHPPNAPLKRAKSAALVYLLNQYLENVVKRRSQPLTDTMKLWQSLKTTGGGSPIYLNTVGGVKISLKEESNIPFSTSRTPVFTPGHAGGPIFPPRATWGRLEGQISNQQYSNKPTFFTNHCCCHKICHERRS